MVTGGVLGASRLCQHFLPESGEWAVTGTTGWPPMSQSKAQGELTYYFTGVFKYFHHHHLPPHPNFKHYFFKRFKKHREKHGLRIQEYDEYQALEGRGVVVKMGIRESHLTQAVSDVAATVNR